MRRSRAGTGSLVELRLRDGRVRWVDQVHPSDERGLDLKQRSAAGAKAVRYGQGRDPRVGPPRATPALAPSAHARERPAGPGRRTLGRARVRTSRQRRPARVCGLERCEGWLVRGDRVVATRRGTDLAAARAGLGSSPLRRSLESGLWTATAAGLLHGLSLANGEVVSTVPLLAPSAGAPARRGVRLWSAPVRARTYLASRWSVSEDPVRLVARWIDGCPSTSCKTDANLSQE